VTPKNARRTKPAEGKTESTNGRIKSQIQQTRYKNRDGPTLPQDDVQDLWGE
jgi:hypothetical protein